MSDSLRAAIRTLGLERLSENGLRGVLRLVQASSAGELIAVAHAKQGAHDLGNGYRLTATKSSMIVSNPGGTQSSVKVSTAKLTSGQRDEAIAKMIGNVIDYFDQNKENIAKGNIKAADVGAAVYGIGWVAVMTVVPPLGALEELTQSIFGVGIGDLAVETGEYLGSIADEAVAILKGESKEKAGEIIGTMATLTFMVVCPSGLGLVAFFGADGWSFTKEVGRAVGGALEDAVEAVGSVAEGVGDFLVGVWDEIF